jgi:hypothetical protein
MSEKDKVEKAAEPPNKAKKRNRTLMIAGVAIVLVIVTVLLLIMQGNGESENVDLEAGSFTIDQSALGPTTFTIQVSNEGSASGSGTLYCYVNIGTDSYNNTQMVTLAAGESTTVTIIVDTPYGTTVTEDMCGVYF